jgi:hypothetical protein
MDPAHPFELKHLRGIPYYVQNGILYAFELSRDEPGKPSRDSIAIGTYDAGTDTPTYAPDWRERVQSRLDTYRATIRPLERGHIRQDLVKPQKSRKASRHSRKTSRTKAPPSQ